jgi:hypothetical protein
MTVDTSPIPPTPERDLLASPPDTPSRLMGVGNRLRTELIRSRAHGAILSERIRELHATEKGRNKTGDRRKPPGRSRFFDISTLNEMREERDVQDCAAEERRARNRGRGRGRGRSASRGRGRDQSRGCGRSRSRGRGRSMQAVREISIIQRLKVMKLTV